MLAQAGGGVVKGFIKLHTSEGQMALHLAVDQIAAFVAYDRYRPNYLSWVTTKDGSRYQVTENTDAIAELIVAETNP